MQQLPSRLVYSSLVTCRGISDSKNEILELNTSAEGKIGTMFVGEGKARF